MALNWRELPDYETIDLAEGGKIYGEVMTRGRWLYETYGIFMINLTPEEQQAMLREEVLEAIAEYTALQAWSEGWHAHRANDLAAWFARLLGGSND